MRSRKKKCGICARTYRKEQGRKAFAKRRKKETKKKNRRERMRSSGVEVPRPFTAFDFPDPPRRSSDTFLKDLFDYPEKKPDIMILGPGDASFVHARCAMAELYIPFVVAPRPNT